MGCFVGREIPAGVQCRELPKGQVRSDHPLGHCQWDRVGSVLWKEDSWKAAWLLRLCPVSDVCVYGGSLRTPAWGSTAREGLSLPRVTGDRAFLKENAAASLLTVPLGSWEGSQTSARLWRMQWWAHSFLALPSCSQQQENAKFSVAAKQDVVTSSFHCLISFIRRERGYNLSFPGLEMAVGKLKVRNCDKLFTPGWDVLMKKRKSWFIENISKLSLQKSLISFHFSCSHTSCFQYDTNLNFSLWRLS